MTLLSIFPAKSEEAASFKEGPFPWETNATFFCNGAQATGFNWENGRWVESSFMTRSYVITKIPMPYGHSSCKFFVEQAEPDAVGDTYAFLSRCYRVKDMNEDGQGFERACREIYDSSRNLTYVNCNEGLSSIKFDPNGEFIYTMDTMFAENNGSRDSLVMMIGRCSEISTK